MKIGMKRISQVHANLAILVSIALLAFGVSHAALADTCESDGTNIFCEEVTTACPPRPGAADALCNGGLVTSFAGLYHNSHKYINESYRATRDFGFGPNVSMLPWIEKEGDKLVLYSPDGSPTSFAAADGDIYQSVYEKSGDLRTIIALSPRGYEVREPAGSWTRFDYFAPTGEALPTKTQSALGLATTIAYADGSARPSSITGPDGRSVTFTASGPKITITDADSQATTLELTNNRITKVTEPGDQTTRIIWNEKYDLVLSIIDPHGLGVTYRYDVQDGQHGVVRQSTDVVASHRYTYSDTKTAVESVEMANANLLEPEAGSVRGYDPMGYVEYLFARYGSGSWDTYVTTVLEGLTPLQTSFAGSVKQDADGRVTETTDSFGLTTTYVYKDGIPFVSEVVNHDKTATAYIREGKERAYAVKSALYLSPERKTLYARNITWAGIDQPKTITAGPIDNSSATQVSFEYQGKLPSKVTTTTRTNLTFDGRGLLTSVSSGDGRSDGQFKPDGFLEKLTSDGDVLDFKRIVTPSNGDVTTTVVSNWFTFDKTVSLSGDTKTRFTVTRDNQDGLARYNFRDIEEMITGHSQTASGPKTNSAPISSIESSSFSTGDTCNTKCWVKRADGTMTTCDGKTTCSQDAQGNTSCTSTSDLNDSRSGDYECVKGLAPKEGEQCCDGLTACPLQDGKCVQPKDCCVADGAIPPTKDTNGKSISAQCCAGQPCASANGACMAVDKCVAPAPTCKNPKDKYCPVTKECVSKNKPCPCLKSGLPVKGQQECCSTHPECDMNGGQCTPRKSCCVSDGVVPEAGQKCCGASTSCPLAGGACGRSADCCVESGAYPPKNLPGAPRNEAALCCSKKQCSTGYVGMCTGPSVACCARKGTQVSSASQCCRTSPYCSLTGTCENKGFCCVGDGGKAADASQCCNKLSFCSASKTCFDPKKSACCGDNTCEALKGEKYSSCEADCCTKSGNSPTANMPCCSDAPKVINGKCAKDEGPVSPPMPVPGSCIESGKPCAAGQRCCSQTGGGVNPGVFMRSMGVTCPATKRCP